MKPLFLTLLIVSVIHECAPAVAFADCSETPISYAELVNIAQKPKVHDVVSFLQSLPANSLTNVTLVHNSESLQKAAISPLVPGVIRGTADGKLIFRYVCQKNSELSDRIEILRFDSKEKQFKTSSIHFSGIGRPQAVSQVFENPQECLQCHADQLKGNTTSKFLKPVWDSYPLWPGLYGSNEDYIHPSKHKRDQAKNSFPNSINPDLEESSFSKFIENEKNNPCYTASIKGDFKTLYREEAYVERSNARRPNLRFSEILGQLSAQTLIQNVSEVANFKDVLPDLARSAFGCGETTESDPDEEYDPSGDLIAPRTGLNGQFLKALSHLGIQDPNLDLSLHGIDGYDFVGGLYAGTTFHNQDMTSISLLRSQVALLLSKQLPDLKIYYTLSRGISEYYTETENACIDDLGGRITMSKNDRNKACAIIKNTFPAQANVQVQALSLPTAAKELSSARLAQLKNLAGYQTMMSSCVMCHAGNSGIRAPQYLENADEFLKRVATDKAFSGRITNRIQSTTAPMPPYGLLPAQEIQNIVEFLEEAQK